MFVNKTLRDVLNENIISNKVRSKLEELKSDYGESCFIEELSEDGCTFYTCCYPGGNYRDFDYEEL